MIWCPYTPSPLRTMARMTALRPGQSPPPVKTPIFIGVLLSRVHHHPGAARRRSTWPVASPTVSRRLEQVVAATQGALVEGERVVASGFCWAAQLGRVPLLFVGRHRYLVVLTDRRLLVFSHRRRRAPRPSDLVIGKRYEWFKLGRVRRARPLLQARVTTGDGNRMIFEFPLRHRELGRTLITRLDGGDAPPAAEPGRSLLNRLEGDAPPAPPAPGAEATEPVDRSGGDESVFGGPSTPTS